MQLLSDATISATGRTAEPLDCARAMLDGMPPVMWFIRRHMRQHRVHGLSVPQFRTLVLLDRFPTASLSLVAEHLGASLPTASRIVAGLVTKGLVTRKTCLTDRRQIALVLTSRGRTALSAATKETQNGVAREISNLNDEQRATIVQAMRMLGDVFGRTLESQNSGL